MPKKKDEVFEGEINEVTFSTDVLKPEEISTMLLEDSPEDKFKMGLVLNGGIDSIVMLKMKREEKPKSTIYPIHFQSDNNDSERMSIINKALDNLKIDTPVKSFKLGPKNDSIEQVIVWCEAEDISYLGFPTTLDESLQVEGRTYQDYLDLNELSDKVTVDVPLIGHTKESIIQYAVKNNIKLEETYYEWPSDKELEKDPQKAREHKIRCFAFKEARDGHDRIIDPFAPKPKQEE